MEPALWPPPDLTCLGWPEEHGGRGLSVAHRVAFYEEYADANAPAKVNHFGEELLGPTLIAYGSAEQQQRFLPKILDVTELWCQGYSEPGAGSDLANVSTTAVLDGDQWVINGQKVWTSMAHSRSGASSWPAPRRAPNATRDCPICWCRSISPVSKCVRSSS